MLMVTVPMALAAADSEWNARQYFVMSTVGHVALMPLLFTEQQKYPIKVSILFCKEEYLVRNVIHSTHLLQSRLAYCT